MRPAVARPSVLFLMLFLPRCSRTLDRPCAEPGLQEGAGRPPPRFSLEQGKVSMAPGAPGGSLVTSPDFSRVLLRAGGWGAGPGPSRPAFPALT